MLSSRTTYGEIFGNDEAFQLFCSVAASGEAQADIVTYLVHSRVTEQRASEQMRALRNALGSLVTVQPSHA
jgi:hypothetical protein